MSEKKRTRASLPVVDQPGAAPKQPSSGLTRRQLLHLGATTAVGGATLASLAIVNRDDGWEPEAGKANELARIKDHRVERAAGANEMAIVRGPDAAANAVRAVEALGGMAAFVRPGERVVVKPNAGWNRIPEQAATSNPDVVAAVVRMAVAAGASKVWVTDVPVNDPERCFTRSGIREAIGLAGGSLVLPNSGGFRHVAVGGEVLRVAEVLEPFVEADRVINVPIVKHHGLSGATAALKNWYGVLGGHRVRLHQDIHRSIVELALMVKPTLTILDATRILVANGPTGGNLADVRKMDLVAASADEVALDAFAVSLLGLRPNDLVFLAEGQRAGLGTIDYKTKKLVEMGS